MSCCSNSKKSPYAKSCQRYYNSAPQALSASSSTILTIAGAKVVDTGVSISTEPASYTINKTGLYDISCDIVVTSTAAGTVQLQAYLDGVALPCTYKVISVDATGTYEIHTETELALSNCCPNISKNITFVVTTDTATGNVVHMCSGVTKLA